MDQHSFLFQAMIYLGAAVLMIPIAKKLGLGSVLGYLLAGILIGPAVLNLIGDQGQDIMHFAEFGVVMMLFVIGLELEPKLLWKLRHTILGLGGLQVLITTLLVFFIAWLGFSLSWQASLALGMTLSLSSTAIVLQSMQEKGQMSTAAGQSSFATLLFQDIAVIPMLAILPILAPMGAGATGDGAHGNSWINQFPGWAQTLITLGSVASIVVAGKYLIRPVFRFVASIRSRELFTSCALLLVVGIAVLMTQVGLSPALGTFLAGVVLANSEFRHELESDIEPFKGLLLGLFFMAVGASINMGLIAEQPLSIAGLVALLILVKGIVLFILGRFFKLGTDQSLIFTFALSQTGEFAFVLFSFASGAGILSNNDTQIMVAVVAISMAMTPLLMLLNEKLILPATGTRIFVNEKEADHVPESEHPVIIAGFGHFGNTVGRYLRVHGIGMTILDHDSDRVELLRKLGFNVYYGDASRHDLLHAAGAERARLMIIAIDNPEKRMEMIETVKKHFPHLRMMVRSRNRFDAYEQMNAGMMHVYRETLDTALRVGVDTLHWLGHRRYSAMRTARAFRKMDEENLKKLSSIREKEQYILTARELIEELENVLRTDRNSAALGQDHGWDEDSLIREAGRAQ